MIAFGKLFIEVLIDIQLTLEEYFVLYCFAYDKKPLIKMYSNNINPIPLKILNNLKERGFLKETDSKKWLITSKGSQFIKDMIDSYEDAKSDNPFLGDEDLVDLAESVYEKEFNSFISTYPIKTTRIDGRVDYLKEGSKEIKKLYLSVLQSGRATPVQMQKAIEYYVKKQKSQGLTYIKTLKNWLKQEIWRDTLNFIEIDNNDTKKDVNYGGKFI